MNEPWWIDVIKALIVVNLVMVGFAYATWLERKLLGRMQLRYGPNRAGPYGLGQPIADLVKLIRKESFAPTGAVDLLYFAAPVVAAFTALASFSVIPFGDSGRSRATTSPAASPTSPSASSSSSRWAPSASTPSSSAAGRATRSTPCWARCGRPHSSSPTRYRWRSPCSGS